MVNENYRYVKNLRFANTHIYFDIFKVREKIKNGATTDHIGL